MASINKDHREDHEGVTEIDRILIASLTGEATDSELQRLEKWRAEDPAHDLDYRGRVRVWELCGELLGADSSDSAPSAEHIQQVAGRAERSRMPLRPRPTYAPTGSGVTASRGRLLRGAAAAVICAVGFGAGALLSNRLHSEPLAPRTLATGINEVATATLADGTVVRVGPESRLEFPIERGDVREVSLDGRAYFSVAPREDVPFRVRLPAGRVEVLGTRFEADTRDDSVRVVVVEGQIRMDVGGGQVRASRNQVVRASDRGAVRVEQVEDAFQVIDWLGPFLAFESTPMEAVADEFRRRFGVEIEIADPALRERRVTGWFTDMSVEEMIAGVCAVIDARCLVEEEERGTVVRMERRSVSVESAAVRGGRDVSTRIASHD